MFCLPTTALSGGVKVIFEFANRLTEDGEAVDVFSFAGPPRWFPLKAPLIEAQRIEDIPLSDYDYVLVSNAFMIPLVLPHVEAARCVFFCQDYESFHHGKGTTYADFMEECPTFVEIYKLPVPIMATSRPVQRLIRERTGRDAFYLPMAIDKSVFYPRPRKPVTDLKRILLVGNYLMPYKGMRDGCEALRKLCAELPVQLVLVTQERRNRAVFNGLPFPIELHYCPSQGDMPGIYASCDAYCCTSWYEGLGLPALECFRCGVPVVSTRTYGVLDYGVDDVNLLLARPNDPHDLYEKLRRLLLDEPLAERLRQAAFETVEKAYDWDASVVRFKSIIDEIGRTYDGAGTVNPRAMQGLLGRLEREGNLTPIAVFRRHQHLAADLHDITRRVLDEGRLSPESVTALQSVRDGFRAYLSNDNAEYYDAFKAKYDLCQLLLSLRDNARVGAYLKLILTRREHGEPHTTASFSEIRYTDA